jgi:predicted nucleic acid-binding protein
VSADTSPRPNERAVFDTVVVNYFLVAGAIELLAALFGGSLLIPRTVFDPDEEDTGRDEGLSELRRGLHLHRRRCEEDGAPPEMRERSEQVLPEFERLPELANRGLLQVVDLHDEELALYANLRSPAPANNYGILLGLGAGEAAMLAICVTRGWLPATDDNDAIAVAKQLIPGVEPLRIRSLLLLAVERNLISLREAQTLHELMRALGFWDTSTL